MFIVNGLKYENKEKKPLGGSPGLVVMGGHSCAKGCEFKSQRLILDGYFYTII